HRQLLKLGEKQPEEVNEKMLNTVNKFAAEHESYKFKTEAEAISALNSIKDKKTARVEYIEKKSRKQYPPIPFNTTCLQATAAGEGFTPARTMRLAENLYMAGLISYPRVDNTVYPKSLNLGGLVKMLKHNQAYAPYCQKLLAQGQLKATRGKKETTDHPPIYPTAAASSDNLPADEFKLYNLIARRFLATLSGPAIIEGVKLYLKVGAQCFIAKGDVLVELGYRGIYSYGMAKQSRLPNLYVGQEIAFDGAYCAYKQTDPPPRYSQARLIQEMEKLNLGTKSTRHSIIERLYEVKSIINDPIEPTARGMAIYNALNKFAPRIMHWEMTSKLEQDMNKVCEGKTTKDKVVYRSRDDLHAQLKNLIEHQEEVAEALAAADEEDSYVGVCPKCGGDLQFRRSKNKRSVFIGCKNWPNCNTAYSVPDGKLEVMEKPCQVCGSPKIKASNFRCRPIIKCIDPECLYNQEPEVFIAQCPNCQKIGKDSRLFAHRNSANWKRSIACENVVECGTRYPLPKNGEIQRTDEFCEDCAAPIVVILTKRGPWRLCPNMKCPSKEKDRTKKKK
ncbi:MAG: topoisomerase DNA-binding C4 zinc finger domain-containing protein, partial [Eggerthellaceae bacterium]|nr:topoisomerase DNA-binding C4 zinc finger domain-containing protein [Eggerthellaceae bacterium]